MALGICYCMVLGGAVSYERGTPECQVQGPAPRPAPNLRSPQPQTRLSLFINRNFVAEGKC